MNWKKLLNSLFNEPYDEEAEEDRPDPKKARNLGQSITFSLLAISLVILFLYFLQSILVPIFFAIIF